MNNEATLTMSREAMLSIFNSAKDKRDSLALELSMFDKRREHLRSELDKQQVIIEKLAVVLCLPEETKVAQTGVTDEPRKQWHQEVMGQPHQERSSEPKMNPFPFPLAPVALSDQEKQAKEDEAVVWSATAAVATFLETPPPARPAPPAPRRRVALPMYGLLVTMLPLADLLKRASVLRTTMEMSNIGDVIKLGATVPMDTGHAVNMMESVGQSQFFTTCAWCEHKVDLSRMEGLAVMPPDGGSITLIRNGMEEKINGPELASVHCKNCRKDFAILEGWVREVLF